MWHETDLQRCPQFGRYREESGHGRCERQLPSLTHFGQLSYEMLLRKMTIESHSAWPRRRGDRIGLRLAAVANVAVWPNQTLATSFVEMLIRAKLCYLG
jgi:hypothetical protein